MSSPNYLTLKEFSARFRLPPATIHRWKNAGKLPYLQPAGKGGLLLFPDNALELAATASAPQEQPAVAQASGRRHLSGSAPKWMRS